MIENAETANEFPIGATGSARTIDDFVALASAVELGVETAAHCARNVGDEAYPIACAPEVDSHIVQDVATFVRLLAPPRHVAGVSAGRYVFDRIGCNLCHTAETHSRDMNGASCDFSPFSDSPFSDLLLHDVGTMAVRTTPLWGLSSFGPPFMHDGSQQTIEAAIRGHGREARQSALEFEQLDRSSRQSLLEFLQKL